MISSCTWRKTKYIVPNINIDIPDKPKLYNDLEAPIYDIKTDKIIYNRIDAAKLGANVVKLKADSDSLRVRLQGIKSAFENLKKVEEK